MSPRLIGGKKKNITVKDQRESKNKKDSSEGTQDKPPANLVLNEKTGESKRETS